MTATVYRLSTRRAAVPQPPAQRALDPTRDEVRGLVRDLAVSRYGGEMGERHVPGFYFPRSDVTPLAGLRAARLVRASAERAVREYIADARADGLSWREIARAVGLTDPVAGPVAVFEDAAGSVYGCLTYRCRSCGELVEDYGPDAGDPAEQVDGHREGCVHGSGSL